MCNSFIRLLPRTILFFSILIFGQYALSAQKYTGSPVTKDRLMRTVQSKQFAVPTIVGVIKKSGVDFPMTTAIEGELVSVGAHRDIISSARTNYRYAGAGGGNNVPKPPVDAAAERYDQLFYQGLQTLNQLRAATTPAQANSLSQSVISTGRQAISLAPSRPEAYILVGSANLLIRNFSEAERYAQSAIDRGGSLAFPVYHLAGSPHLEVLHIGRGFITVESAQKFFQYNAGEVSDIGTENDYQFGNVRAAAFSIETYKNGAPMQWYFSPGNTGTTPESNLIIRLIQKNVLND